MKETRSSSFLTAEALKTSSSGVSRRPELTSTSKWVDPDDEELRISIASDKRLRKLRKTQDEDIIAGNEYEQRLRNQFEAINPVPQWANKSRKKRRRDEMEDDDKLLSRVEKIINTNTSDAILPSTRHTLEKGIIDIERLRDGNQVSKTEGDIKAVMFHPSPSVSVMLSAGGDRRLKLFTVDGKTNPLLQTVHIPSLPIGSAVFHPSGSTVLLTGPRPFFFRYDLQSGVCSKSPRGLWGTFTSKVDDGEHSLEISAFSPAGDVLAVAGRQGRIYLVDWKSGSPQVIASFKMNTPVKSFSELLVMSSRVKKDQLRLVHLPSLSVFSNWPTFNSPLGRINTSAFSPNSEYLAIGNTGGRVLLYGLHHYWNK
ncbi:hypothetical protein FRB91_009524 [Serendipita sp. 411]|nr:hypothetical protein FRB91_009524 [Serendipita sp. 411]